MLSIGTLFLLGVAYLLALFAVAFCTDRGWIPDRVVRHPLVYVLSLGVYISAWGFYGIADIAHAQSYEFLTYFFGIAGFFMFGPLILLPLQRICQDFQLASLADLLTFRYRSQWAGIFVTLFLSVSMLPLFASQIKAVTLSAQILTQTDTTANASNNAAFGLAFVFCLAIGWFTMSYGARQVSYRQRHNGLVVAIAFETVIKTLAFLAIGAASIMGVFGGTDGMASWLEANPDVTANYDLAAQQEGRTLLLLSFAAALGMPHMFHMVFSEKPTQAALRASAWGVPLLLLVFSLPVLPILWGTIAGQSQPTHSFHTLAIGQLLNSPALCAIAYIGGLSAASGLMIVSTLALASMYLNHLILPFYQPSADKDIYSWLVWIRRILIATIVLSGYLFYHAYAVGNQLFELGICAFAAILQFLPGVLALLFVPTINRQGFLAGLIGGICTWFVMLFLPTMTHRPLPLPGLGEHTVMASQGWTIAVIGSFAVNVILMLVASACYKTSEEEKSIAALCSLGGLSRPNRQGLRYRSIAAIQQALASALGGETAAWEVEKALQDLALKRDEARPAELRRLCYQIEANLSGLLGTTLGRDLVRRLLLFDDDSKKFGGDDVQQIETRLEGLQMHFTGLAAELNHLRHFHRQTLMDLPIGVCMLGRNDEIVLWNHTMATISDVDSAQITGATMEALPAPWDQILSQTASQSTRLRKIEVLIDDTMHCLTLNKAESPYRDGQPGDTIVLVEDITDSQRLEQKLIHSERLASVGRLAAGVAHEIGNPVTGIACLAQNLQADREDPELKETAQDILTQTERITTIVQTLVNFSHVGQQRSHQHESPATVDNCITEAIKLLQLDKDATQVHFVNQCDPRHQVIGDPQRLIQVFLNLLSNARDACQKEQLVHISSRLLNEQYLEINVTDEGSGIAAAQLGRVFEPFFTTKNPGEGTGLGLALVYSIIEDQGGSIQVESPLEQSTGGGTRFLIRLRRHHNSGNTAATLEKHGESS
jgi:signal transduction histidine kinase/Na+/proline symporter